MKIELFAFCLSRFTFTCLFNIFENCSRSFLYFSFRSRFDIFNFAHMLYSNKFMCIWAQYEPTDVEKWIIPSNNINKRKWFYFSNRKRSLWMMKKKRIWSKSQTKIKFKMWLTLGFVSFHSFKFIYVLFCHKIIKVNFHSSFDMPCEIIFHMLLLLFVMFFEVYKFWLNNKTSKAICLRCKKWKTFSNRWINRFNEYRDGKSAHSIRRCSLNALYFIRKKLLNFFFS